MKTIIMAVVVVGVMAVLANYSYQPTVEYVRSESAMEVAEEVKPTVPEEWLKEAEEAKESVLRRKALEKERGDLESQIKEDQARIKAIDAEVLEIMKKSTLY
jgi:Tfp pilus assembly protein PilE